MRHFLFTLALTLLGSSCSHTETTVEDLPAVQGDKWAPQKLSLPPDVAPHRLSDNGWIGPPSSSPKDVFSAVSTDPAPGSSQQNVGTAPVTLAPDNVDKKAFAPEKLSLSTGAPARGKP